MVPIHGHFISLWTIEQDYEKYVHTHQKRKDLPAHLHSISACCCSPSGSVCADECLCGWQVAGISFVRAAG
jgi:hypothetical protein